MELKSGRCLAAVPCSGLNPYQISEQQRGRTLSLSPIRNPGWPSPPLQQETWAFLQLSEKFLQLILHCCRDEDDLGLEGVPRGTAASVFSFSKLNWVGTWPSSSTLEIMKPHKTKERNESINTGWKSKAEIRMTALLVTHHTSSFPVLTPRKSLGQRCEK